LDAGGRRVGDYELLEEIARGGMGIVYLARQTRLGRNVALKMILNGVLADDTAIARFKAEASSAAALSHPNIVTIHEIGEAEGRHFFSMEYVAGRTLAELVRDGPLRARVAAGYIERVALAVSYAHECGVLHRDLKPSNVLIDGQGQPRVTDFGLAKRVGSDSDLTLTGQVLGTPAYMSPEQAGGAKFGLVDGRSDVYSLGAVLYHAVCGLAPFSGESATEILRQVIDVEPVAPRVLNAGLSRDLETICLKCLAKEPSHRYASALELAEDLGRFLDGAPILARPAGRVEKLWRWSRRQPALAAALGSCLVILVAGVSGILWELRLTKAARTVAIQKAQDEETQRKAAQQSELVMRQNLYSADMPGVQRALAEYDLGSARVLLDAHRPKAGQPDLRGFEWRYFWAQAQGGSLKTLSGYAYGISALSFSADGKWMAFGVRDVVVCDTATLQVRARATNVPGVESIAFIPHTQSLLIGTRKPSVVLRWNWLEQGGPQTFVDPRGWWPNVVVSPTAKIVAVGCGSPVYSGEGEGATTLYDLRTGSALRALPEAGGIVAFSGDGKRLATGSWLGTIKLWNPATGELTGVLTNAAQVLALRFSPDGLTLAMCSHSNGFWLYDLVTGEKRPMARVHGTYVDDAAFSPDGSALATSSPDGTVRLWNLKTGAQTACWRGHRYQVACVAWAPDGKFVASGGNDGTVRFWKTNQAESAAVPLAGQIKKNFFSPDGRFFMLENSDGQVTLYEFPSLKAVGGPQPVGHALGLRGDPDAVVSLRPSQGQGSSDLVEWSVPDIKPRRVIPLAESAGLMSPSVLSRDARLLAASPGPGKIIIWDLAAGAKPIRVKAPDGEIVGTLGFSPDDRILAGNFISIQSSTVIYLWDTASGQLLTRMSGHGAFVTDTAFSPDGRLMVSGETDKAIKLWDMAQRKELGTLGSPKASTKALDFSPDGKTIASGTTDQTLRLWNVVTQREVARFDLPANIISLTFSPDGSALLFTQRTGQESEPSTYVWRAPGFQETDSQP
jgi:WD40 repeat protein/predicted Ser/Thr protein kinase